MFLGVSVGVDVDDLPVLRALSSGVSRSECLFVSLPRPFLLLSGFQYSTIALDLRV
jgi:hypothetical protein